MKVSQSCATLCNPMDYVAHGILQARILERVASSLLQGIFLTQGSNPGLLHCRQFLYQLSHQGSHGHHTEIRSYYIMESSRSDQTALLGEFYYPQR